MKILKESNEKLPITVITDFVSEGWGEVGKIKSEIEAIKGFKEHEAVSEVLQKLVDSYLVCIGQLEAFLQDKKYVKDLDDLKEAVDIHIENGEVTIADASGEDVAIIPVETEEAKAAEVIEDSEEKAEEEIEVEPAIISPKEAPILHDKFEYFVDFDDPIDAEPITDAEIEQLQKVGK